MIWGKFCAALTCIIFTAGQGAADPISGLWQTNRGADGTFAHVRVAPCGDALCATLETGFDSQGQPAQTPLAGRKIFWDMRPQTDQSYGKGKIYSPDHDRTFNGRLTLRKNEMDLIGCVLAICRTGGTWQRIGG